MSELKNVSGLSELDKALTALPDKLQRNVLRGALRAGAKVIADIAKSTVPVESGALRGTIRVGTYVRGGVAHAKVTAGNPKKRVYYAHMVEGGTKPHEIRPKGAKSLFFAGIRREIVKHPGAKAKPFMAPALKSGADAAIKTVADTIRKNLDKAVQK